jgi:hypothetical protein
MILIGKGGKKKMKKILILLLAVLMVASVAYAQKAMKITAKDLAGMKGTWLGTLTFDVGVNCPAKLEILNDSVPVQAKLTLSNVPEQITQMLATTGGTKTWENSDGKITTQGSLMWAGEKNFFEVFKKGDKKADGWFYYQGARGTLVVTKK